MPRTTAAESRRNVRTLDHVSRERYGKTYFFFYVYNDNMSFSLYHAIAFRSTMLKDILNNIYPSH